MNEKIFRSNFTNIFRDRKYQIAYKQKTTSLIFLFTKWITIFLLLLSVMASVLTYLSKNRKEYKIKHSEIDLRTYPWIIYVITGLFLISSILLFTFRKNYLLAKFGSYFNYYGIIYIFIYITLYIFMISEKTPTLYTFLIFFFEFTIRLFFIFFDLIDFIESLIINLMVIFTVWILYYSFGMLEIEFDFLFFHNIKVIIACIYAYFYSRQAKKAFFYHEKETEKFLWYQSVLENMNSGFMLIKNNTIDYMNNYMVNLFYNKSHLSDSLQKKNCIVSEENIKLLNNNQPTNNERRINKEKIKKRMDEIKEKLSEIEDYKDKNLVVKKDEQLITENFDELNFIKINEKQEDENIQADDVILENENDILKRIEEELEKEQKQLRLEKEQIKIHSEKILNELFVGIEFSESINSTIKEKSKHDASFNDEMFNNKNLLQTLKDKILKEDQFFLVGTKAIKKNESKIKKINFNDENKSDKLISENLCDENNNLKKIENFNNSNTEKQEEKNEENYFYFDISIRFYKNQEEDNYEIILNDVTRVKLNEKKNAEFKYKTIFLSKVAHEFKNPLICIIELIDQLHDLNKNVNFTDVKLFNELALQIKGISNYLLILVKDLDYFSISQTKLKYNLEYEKCNLEDIIQFVKDMGMILLKKANKEGRVKFNIEKDPNLNVFITTDEIKLKQILVNLLSNSVKFTHKGEIRLQIANNLADENNVDFVLKDTGIGMKKEKQNFSLFQKNVDKTNNLGSGLGMYIIAELSGQIGTHIKIKSELGQGSEFRFTVINNDALLQKIIEDETKKLKNKNFKESQTYNSKNKHRISFKHKSSKNSINSSSRNFKASATYNNFRPLALENSSFLELVSQKGLKENCKKAEVRSQCPRLLNRKDIYVDSSKSSNTRLITENNYYINQRNIYIFNNNDNSNLNYKNKRNKNQNENNYDLNNNINKENNNVNQNSFINEKICINKLDYNRHHYQNNDQKSRNSVSLSCIDSNPSVNSQIKLSNRKRNQNKNLYNSNIFSSNRESGNELVVNDPNKKNIVLSNNSFSSAISNLNKDNVKKLKSYKTRNAKESNKTNIEILSEKESETKTNLKEINIIVTDDEDLTRQSTIRMIRKNFEVNNLNKKYELTIYEARDGLDCLYKFYNLISDGNEIYCIISDESMNFLNGSESSVVVKKVLEKKEDKKIPFYLVTAYPKENFFSFLKNSIDDLFNKPINFEDVNIIFRSLISNSKEKNNSQYLN